MLGAAEVDKYGKINTTVIGSYRSPSIRLPGSGGADDAASHSKRIVILIPHEKRRLPEKVSLVTSPGYIHGPGDREKAGLKRGGPSRVITDLAVLGFDHESKMMKLESLHQGVSSAENKENTGFEIMIPKNIRTTEPPTTKQLKLLRSKIDPPSFYREKWREL